MVEYKSHIARVPILSPRSEELTARETTRGPEHATKIHVPLMEGGPIGRRGRNAVSRVVVELETGLELAAILLHNMAAKNAVDQRRKCNLATSFHAQLMANTPSGNLGNPVL